MNLHKVGNKFRHINDIRIEELDELFHVEVSAACIRSKLCQDGYVGPFLKATQAGDYDTIQEQLAAYRY
jgi:hypothetical protein